MTPMSVAKMRKPRAKHRGKSERASPVPASQLWLVVLGFCVWCSALVFSYALHSVGCAFAWPADKLRLIIGLTIIVHLGVVGWLWRIGSKATSDPALGESGSFFHWVIVCILISAFVTIVFTLGPAMLLTICV
jgi:hypothetical protein